MAVRKMEEEGVLEQTFSLLALFVGRSGTQKFWRHPGLKEVVATLEEGF